MRDQRMNVAAKIVLRIGVSLNTGGAKGRSDVRGLQKGNLMQRGAKKTQRNCRRGSAKRAETSNNTERGFYGAQEGLVTLILLNNKIIPVLLKTKTDVEKLNGVELRIKSGRGDV